MSELNENQDNEQINVGESAASWTPQIDSKFPLNSEQLESRDRAEEKIDLSNEKLEIIGRIQSGDHTELDLRRLDEINIGLRAADVQRPVPKDAGHIPPQE